MTVVDPNARRLARLASALEDVERWAEQEAEVSHADPEWRARRAHVALHPDALHRGALHADATHDGTTAAYRLALFEIEGAESGYADAAARVAHLRAQLVDEGAARVLYEAIVDALHGELAWADAQREEALAAQGAALEPEELHAKGRARAFAAIRVELRRLLDAAPWGTP
jgi:hypothetical protein